MTATLLQATAATTSRKECHVIRFHALMPCGVSLPDGRIFMHDMLMLHLRMKSQCLHSSGQTRARADISCAAAVLLPLPGFNSLPSNAEMHNVSVWVSLQQLCQNLSNSSRHKSLGMRLPSCQTLPKLGSSAVGTQQPQLHGCHA